MIPTRVKSALKGRTSAAPGEIPKYRARRTFRAAVETLENRRLLSGTAYTFHQVGYFGANGAGASPRCTLAADTAGNLFGTTSEGGAYGGGTVFETPAGSSTVITLASFNGVNGSYPSDLTLDAAGNLYGTAAGGGSYGDGTVFEVPNGSDSITTLASFNGGNGKNPEGGVTLDSAGNLYGTTESGGANTYYGTVFKIARPTNTLTTLVSFNSPEAYEPVARVTLDSAGNLYGTTDAGGANGYGTVFEVPVGTNSATTLASFPQFASLYYSAVTLDSSGDLFGTSGDSSANGSVFEVVKGSGTITKVVSFSGSDPNPINGAYPIAGVTLDSSGNLYGTTYTGGFFGDGSVFEIAKGTSTITTLASFDPPTDGSNPEGGLVLDTAGNLYGTTYNGGANGQGTVFKVAKGSNTLTTLTAFAYFEGTAPLAGMTLDSAGNLYGTAYSGGASGDGTVFEIAHGSNAITTLVSFNGADGAHPQAGVTLDSAGNLYGTTDYGGASDDGTVFEIANGSNTITTLASFDSTNGANPLGVILDAAGNLYGTAYHGGGGASGTVFEIVKGSNTITTLVSFTPYGSQGPEDGLVMDSAGNLYGTTYAGGAHGAGTVFEIAKGSSIITTLASFDYPDGWGIHSGVVLDAAGNLYGTSAGGQGSFGAVFEIAKGSGATTTLTAFNTATAGTPLGGVALDSAGNLYGTAETGGPGGAGIVFEIAKGSNSITPLASFDSTNGANPEAGVILDPAGNLYGTTYAGGAGNKGTAFELALTPTSDTINASGNDTITLKKDFGGVNVDWTIGAASGVLPIDDPNGLTINDKGGSNVIDLDYTGGDPLPASLHLNGTFTINGLQNLNGTALDIGQSTVFVNYAGSADPLSWIRQSLQAGYNAGAWNGQATSAGGAITTSAAGNLYGIGYADSADGSAIDAVPNTVELKYTVMGDANLDGTVKLADLLALTRHFGRTGGWDSGDFNYDGAINLSDFLTLTRHFGQSLPPTLSASDLLLPASPDPNRLAARRVR